MSDLEKVLIEAHVALVALIDERIALARAADDFKTLRRTWPTPDAEPTPEPPAAPPSSAIDLGEGFSYEVEE